MEETFLKFCTALRGFKLYYNGREMPKFIAYYKHYTSDDILLNRTPIRLEKRKLKTA